MVLLGMQKKVEELMEQNVEEKEINMCKVATLVQKLLKDGRTDVLELAMADSDYRTKLYTEYQLN